MQRRRRHAGAAAAVVVALALVTACTGQDDVVDDMTDSTTDTTRSPSGAERPPDSTAAPEVFEATVVPITATDLGASWTDGLGCTPPDELAAIDMAHWGVDGTTHQGRLIVAAGVADDVVAIFARLFEARFPIERMEPVSVYGGDDDASMRANNTSGYNCRTIAGTSRLSNHAFGLAIDINPLVNPWVHDGIVDPPEGDVHADRSRTEPGMIHADDTVVGAFEAHGWSWGGYWNEPDYQHFSTTGD